MDEIELRRIFGEVLDAELPEIKDELIEFGCWLAAHDASLDGAEAARGMIYFYIGQIRETLAGLIKCGEETDEVVGGLVARLGAVEDQIERRGMPSALSFPIPPTSGGLLGLVGNPKPDG